MLGTVKPNCPLTLKWILDCSDLHFWEYIFYCAVTFLFPLLSVSFIKLHMIVDVENQCTVVDLNTRLAPLIILNLFDSIFWPFYYQILWSMYKIEMFDQISIHKTLHFKNVFENLLKGPFWPLCIALMGLEQSINYPLFNLQALPQSCGSWYCSSSSWLQGVWFQDWNRWIPWWPKMYEDSSSTHHWKGAWTRS